MAKGLLCLPLLRDVREHEDHQLHRSVHRDGLVAHREMANPRRRRRGNLEGNALAREGPVQASADLRLVDLRDQVGHALIGHVRRGQAADHRVGVVGVNVAVLAVDGGEADARVVRGDAQPLLARGELARVAR